MITLDFSNIAEAVNASLTPRRAMVILNPRSCENLDSDCSSNFQSRSSKHSSLKLDQFKLRTMSLNVTFESVDGADDSRLAANDQMV